MVVTSQNIDMRSSQASGNRSVFESVGIVRVGPGPWAWTTTTIDGPAHRESPTAVRALLFLMTLHDPVRSSAVGARCLRGHRGKHKREELRYPPSFLEWMGREREARGQVRARHKGSGTGLLGVDGDEPRNHVTRGASPAGCSPPPPFPERSPWRVDDAASGWVEDPV